LGAYQAIRQRGLSIPADVAVVGFDNHELIATSVRPELTTIELPHYAMGQWAVEHLLADPAGGSFEPDTEQRKLPCPLVIRESA
jgi:LacI family transcriptional regulator